MAHRQHDRELVESLRQRRYEYELARWRQWQAQQDRLNRLIPQALDVIEDALLRGGPDATKVAMEMIRMTNLSGSVNKPQRVLIDLEDPDDLVAGLPEPDEPSLPDKASG